MKIYFKTLFLAAMAAFLTVGCVDDDDTELPPYSPLLLSEKFEVGLDNTLLVTEGWTNFAEVGTTTWKIQRYSDNGYAEFNTYQSGNVSNVGWLVSPGVVVETNNTRKLIFQAAQAYVTSAQNKLEVFISTDFDGTNVAAATWNPVEATLPDQTSEFFEFINSGDIDLSAYSGTIHVAFKVTGSGTNTQLDGQYQIDNVIVY
jgi:hypothetical protein